MTISAKTAADILNACGLYKCEFMASSAGELYYRPREGSGEPCRATKIINVENWLSEAVVDIRQSVKIARGEV